MVKIEEYLKSTFFIDCETKSIKEKAQDLTEGQQETTDKAKSLFYFVRDEIKYQPFSRFHLPEYYRASAILDIGGGYCIQKAVLFAALARAAGIPARLRLIYLRNNLLPDTTAEVLGGIDLFLHGYDELYIEGKWVKATPTFDIEMCREHRIIPVEFDGKHNALFHSHNLDGKLHIEYLKDDGHYQDLPLNKILDHWLETYGAELVEEFKKTFGQKREQ